MSAEGLTQNLSDRDGLGSLGSQIPWGIRVLLLLHWSLRNILAGMFLFFALTKLFGSAAMMAFFFEVGWGQWFRYLCGGVELLGAGLLLAPRTWWLGWAVLVTGTIATILLQLRTFEVGEDAFPWVQVLAALSVLAVLPRPRALRALIDRVRGNGAGG